MIEQVDKELLDVLVQNEDDVVVYFYSDKCKECDMVLAELENIDDDTDQHHVHFVKSNDAELAAEFGIEQPPALIYFEDGRPNLYEGDLTEEEKVLEWILHHKEHDTIETVNGEILEDLAREEDYVVAFFCKLVFRPQYPTTSLFSFL